MTSQWTIPSAFQPSGNFHIASHSYCAQLVELFAAGRDLIRGCGTGRSFRILSSYSNIVCLQFRFHTIIRTRGLPQFWPAPHVTFRPLCYRCRIFTRNRNAGVIRNMTLYASSAYRTVFAFCRIPELVSYAISVVYAQQNLLTGRTRRLVNTTQYEQMSRTLLPSEHAS